MYKPCLIHWISAEDRKTTGMALYEVVNGEWRVTFPIKGSGSGKTGKGEWRTFPLSMTQEELEKTIWNMGRTYCSNVSDNGEYTNIFARIEYLDAE